MSPANRSGTVSAIEGKTHRTEGEVPSGSRGPELTGRPWSLPSKLTLAAAATALLLGAAWHLALVFLDVAPPSTVSRHYQDEISAHLEPEYVRNWRLFAPDPKQVNLVFRARARTASPDGVPVTSPWVDLTARELARIRHNPLPSQVDQSLLRHAWRFYDATHDRRDEGATGYRGNLAETYLTRILLHRLGGRWNGQPIVEVQFQVVTTPITGPAWTGAPTEAEPSYRTLPWWPVGDADRRGLSNEH